MTQTRHLAAETPASRWSQALQTKLMAALDAIWAILERSDDPGEIRQARDRARAIGELAAMARKVAQIAPAPRKAHAPADEGDIHARQDLSERVEDLQARVCPPLQAPESASKAAPKAAQAEHTRRALEKLKGGGRARI